MAGMIIGEVVVAAGAGVVAGAAAAMRAAQDRNIAQHVLEEHTVEQNCLLMHQNNYVGKKCTNMRTVQMMQHTEEGFDGFMRSQEFAEIIVLKAKAIFLESLHLRPGDPALHREFIHCEQEPDEGATGYWFLIGIQALEPEPSQTVARTAKSALESRTKEEVRDDMISEMGDRFTGVANTFHSYAVTGMMAKEITDVVLKVDFKIDNRLMRMAILSHLKKYSETQTTKSDLEKMTREEVRDKMISEMGCMYSGIANMMCSFAVDGKCAAQGFSDADLQNFNIEDSVMRKAVLSHLEQYRPVRLCMVGITASSIRFDHSTRWYSNSMLPLETVKRTMLSMMAKDNLQPDGSNGPDALEDYVARRPAAITAGPPVAA